MNDYDFQKLIERDPELALALLYLSQMSRLEKSTYMSNYDRFKEWLCNGLGIAKSAVQSAWNWFKSLF
jgi:hypothetical protein